MEQNHIFVHKTIEGIALVIVAENENDAWELLSDVVLIDDEWKLDGIST
jgi:hypothetical protein